MRTDQLRPNARATVSKTTEITRHWKHVAIGTYPFFIPIEEETGPRARRIELVERVAAGARALRRRVVDREP